MPTSSEVYDYTPQLPTSVPDFLREWAERREYRKNALIWKVDWLREPMTGLKHRAARAHCTACGQDMWLDYSSGGTCHGCGYGPRLFVNHEHHNNYSVIPCPECGREIQICHISNTASYADEWAYPMTLHRVKRHGQTDRLALVCWSVHKYHLEDGRREIEIRPYEAVVVEEGRMISATKHASCMQNTYETEWRQKTRFQDTMKEIIETVCPEGIAEAVRGTTAENAKLELYMSDGAICFPASWLRIWQKHENAETLMTCGAGEIISNLIGQEKRDSVTSYRQNFGTAIPQLKMIRWKERRPSRMLGMDRGELRQALVMQESEHPGGMTWRAWLEARAAGKTWTIEDLPALETLGRQDRARELEDRPVKVLRYLTVQQRRWGKKSAEIGMLLDYWRMLREVKQTALDKEELWPECLKKAHDRMMQMKKDQENALLDAAFAKRAEKLAVLTYHSGGLFIAPPVRAADLAEEGKKLHHCVESYTKDHANGRTTILFIRKENEPEEPFYTLEWNEKRRLVLQNRGYKNHGRTDEVQAFENEWLAWVKAGCRRNKDGTPIVPKTKKESAAA